MPQLHAKLTVITFNHFTIEPNIKLSNNLIVIYV